MLLEFTLLLSLAIYLLYRWSTSTFGYFQDRGLPHAKPTPLFGNFMKMVLKKSAMFDLVRELYNEHDGPVYGVFDQRRPVTMIRDPELIKKITIKDFDHFVNHIPALADDNDDGDDVVKGNNSADYHNTDGMKLFSASLVTMKNNKWKDMRSTLSPAFTGSKMRSMFQLMNQVAQETLVYFKKQQGVCTKDGLDMEIKDFMTRFTNDIIASTAFGLQVNSYEEKDNEFYRMGKKLTTLTFVQNIKFLLYPSFKKIMKLLNIQVFDKDASQYFMRLVMDAMKYRKDHNIIRPDMINMLMESQGMLKTDNPKPVTREWSDVDIVGQCFLFFFAGFETSATLTCFTLHELMENTDVQDRLLQEIQDMEQELDGQLVSYEKLQAMPYMEMVVQECLRKWPNAITTDRVCTKDISYDLGNGKKLDLKVGDCIWLPMVGLHRDPKYYPNPEKYDPERFSEENKDNIKPFTFMPFGVGPRNCIGSRFALLETKVLLYYLVRDFKIEAAKKSCIPMKLDVKSFQIRPENGFWLKFKART